MPANLVAIGNEHPDARLECKVIRPHPSISSYARGVSEIQIQIPVPRTQMHPVAPFGAPIYANSVSGGGITVIRKIIGTSKI
ncbi:hypothetical protein TNCV_278731 [Trichonephila clavipes]|nr:hypothetical protein TNCV_278731 [Trichonephila clavipes]